MKLRTKEAEDQKLKKIVRALAHKFPVLGHIFPALGQDKDTFGKSAGRGNVS